MVVPWWRSGYPVVLVGSVATPAWPHVLVRGSVGQPVMVPEPPLALVVSRGSSWIRIDALDELWYRGYASHQGCMLGSKSSCRLRVSELDQ